MKLLLPAFIFLLLANCNQTHSQQTQRSFYYWKTTFRSSTNTDSIINGDGINHFYIHYFDVEWSNSRWMPVPVAEITNFSNAYHYTQVKFTPVIYITNRVFYSLNDDQCETLATNIRNKVLFITNRIEESRQKNMPAAGRADFDEIQIDCDWTHQTQPQYFYFLLAIKKMFPGKMISATIRLYPYKYADKMGVPPVDKGLLMCYNLTDIKNSKTTNSIFNIDDFKQYMVAQKYPLPLDLALPVFGWYAWFSKDGTFKGIVYPGNNDVVDSNTGSFKKNAGYSTVQNDTTISETYLQEGDVLRSEFPPQDQLEEAAKILHERFPSAGRITLYHWDDALIKRYEKTISNIYALF